jgi:hypothetical protein
MPYLKKGLGFLIIFIYLLGILGCGLKPIDGYGDHHQRKTLDIIGDREGTGSSTYTRPKTGVGMGSLVILFVKPESTIEIEKGYARAIRIKVKKSESSISKKISAGTYKISLYHPDYKTIIKRRITIQSERRTEIVLKEKDWILKSKKVTFSYLPEGAEVLINDQKHKYRKAKYDGIELSYGTYEIKATHPDYKTVPPIKQFAVNRKSQRPIKIFKEEEWVKRQGYLNILGLMKDSKVTVINKWSRPIKPFTPYDVKDSIGKIEKKIDIGKYTIEIKHRKYVDIKHKITIKENETELLDVGESWKIKTQKARFAMFPEGARAKIDDIEYTYKQLTKDGVTLDYGRHTLIAFHKDYKAFSKAKEFDVYGQKTTYWIYKKHDWKKLEGKIKFKGLKENCSIFVYENNKPVPRFSPLKSTGEEISQNIDIGEYHYEVKHWQFKDIIGKSPVKIVKKQETVVNLNQSWIYKNGKLKINQPEDSPEKTEIIIGDRNISYSEFKVNYIPLYYGRHMFKASHPDYEPMAEVDLLINKPTSDYPPKNKWIRKRGTLYLEAKNLPSRTEFKIDETKFNLNRLLVGSKLKTGKHKLIVSHWQYYPHEQTFEIKWEEPYKITLPPMKERLGTIVLQDIKKGSRIFIGGTDKTGEIRNNKIKYIIGDHNITIKHWQHYDLIKTIRLTEAQPAYYASAQDWASKEKKGSIVFDVIKPNSSVFIDGNEIKNARANVKYNKIIGEHSYKILNDLYIEISGNINLAHNGMTHLSPENEWAYNTVDIKTKGFDGIIYFDGDSNKFNARQLELQINKRKKIYTIVLKRKGKSDPINDFMCFALPLGEHGSIVREDGFILDAGNKTVTLEGDFEKGSTAFLFDETGRNIKSFKSSLKNASLKRGSYQLKSGKINRYFEIPYASYIYFGEANTQERAEKLLEKEPLVAFHIYKLHSNKEGMQIAWFKYCEKQTNEITSKHAKDKNKIMDTLSLWSRVAFDSKLMTKAKQYKTQLNRLRGRL